MRKELIQMEREELCMGALSKPVKECVKEFGKEATLEALKWVTKNIKAIDESEFRKIS